MERAELLNSYWNKSGKTKRHVAETLHISRPKLDRIFSDPTTATYSQASIISAEFNITKRAERDAIFMS